MNDHGYIYVQVNPNASIHEGELFSNIMSGGALSTPTNGYAVSDNSFIWRFKAKTNTSTGVDLSASINPEAYNICQGTYCQNAANVIVRQVATGNSVFTPYALVADPTVLQTAFSQATPELTNENIQVVQLNTRAVEDVIPMWGVLHGQSSGDAMLDQAGKLWMKPYGAGMTQNQHNTVPGFNAAAYGAVIGKDMQLTDDWLVGGAFAAGGDNMQGQAALSTQSINSTVYQGMLYGSKKLPNHIYFAGQGLVGFENNDTKRTIPLYASTARGSYDSWFTNIRGELGWSSYTLGKNFVLTPEIDVSYLYVNQGSYQELGSPMNLLVGASNNSSLILGAYCNGAYNLASVYKRQNLTLTGYVGVAGDVLSSQPQVSAAFIAGGPYFNTFGVQFNQAVFRGGAGLVLTNPNNPFSINLNYDAQVGNNAYSNIGSATIKYIA